MSAERVVDEIEHISRRYPAQGIYFRDDHFTLKKQRVVDICEGLLRRNVRMPWMCLGRTEGLDEEVFKLMKRSGCRGIWFGLESGSRRILSLIRKEIDTNGVLEVINAGKRAGLAIGGSFIVGFPTQTMAEEEETIEFLKKAKLTFVMIAPYVGYPGSDMYREFLSDGGKYVYSEITGIILPNSEDMSWPEKVEWSQRCELKFNRTLERVSYYVRTHGAIRTIGKATKSSIRTLRSQKK